MLEKWERKEKEREWKGEGKGDEGQLPSKTSGYGVACDDGYGDLTSADFSASSCLVRLAVK